MDGEQQRFVVDDLDVGHVRLDLDRPGGNQLTAREGVRHDDVRVAGSKNLVPTLIIISLSGGGIAQRYRSRYSPSVRISAEINFLLSYCPVGKQHLNIKPI